ncbi:MAG: KdsC family phosphatase [Candidatus Paceibacteria bacterium]
MLDQDKLDRLKSLKGLILDADGVWFSGHEYRMTLPDGQVVLMKKRHFHDGQGLSFLRALGIKVVFATGEGEPLQSIVRKINELPSAQSGEWAPVDLFTGELKKGGKVASLEVWMQKHDLSWEDCAYIGDDRTDLEAMQKAGLKVVPSNARRLIRKIADITLLAAGGEGAVREFAEMVLDARGVDEATLPAA